MKPDKKMCLNCGKQISNRAKYCSDKCRKQYERNPDKKPDKTNSDTDISQLGQAKSDSLRDSLSKTDKTFYDRAMRDFNEPYYNFDGAGFKDHKSRDGKCGYCGAKYSTMLALNKYCSYDHYRLSLSAVVQ